MWDRLINAAFGMALTCWVASIIVVMIVRDAVCDFARWIGGLVR